MKNKNRIFILNQILNKSNLIMDDIVQLMMQIYSTNNSVLETKEIENYRSILIEQLKK